jgi:hypothetical protein
MPKNEIVTPAQVEAKLKSLSKELDTCHDELVKAEYKYYKTKAQYEIAMAETRLSLARQSAPNGRNYTVGEREDMAIVANRDKHIEMAEVDALVRATRANAQRLRAQVDIARSVGTSVRTSMEVV